MSVREFSKTIDFALRGMNNLLRSGFFIFIFIFIFGVYFAYQSRNLFARPEIFVENLEYYNVFYNSFLPIKGRAENTNALHLNGAKVLIDENGFFEKELLLAYGYNIIQIKAKDRFGSETVKDYIVILKN